jgi:hypothetical protein
MFLVRVSRLVWGCPPIHEQLGLGLPAAFYDNYFLPVLLS